MTSVGQPASSTSNNWRLPLATAVLALAFVASMPAAARAQSSIAGVVTAYDDRLNKLDARFSRVLSVGRSRFLASLDVFNVLNSSAPILLNTRVGPNWLTPTQNLGARLFRVSGQVDF